MTYFVFVDDHAEFSQKAVGQTGATQRGEQLPDCLLRSLPHTPAATEQNRNRGVMIHPAGELPTGKNSPGTQALQGLNVCCSLHCLT